MKGSEVNQSLRLRIGFLGLIAATITRSNEPRRVAARAGSIGCRSRGRTPSPSFPKLGLDPVKFDYKLKVEYIVDTRYGKEAKPTLDEEEAKPPVEEVAVKKAVVKKGSRAKKKDTESPASKVTGAIDLSLHSFERIYPPERPGDPGDEGQPVDGSRGGSSPMRRPSTSLRGTPRRRCRRSSRTSTSSPPACS